MNSHGSKLDHHALCSFYTTLGAGFSDILRFLAQIHSVCISMRTLMRRLNRQKFVKRPTLSETISAAEVVKNGIEEQIYMSGQIPTLKWMVRRCNDGRISVSEQRIKILMQILDPVKTESRLRREIRRKGCIGLGPDYIWHIGAFCVFYEIGIYIYFGIDGFSKKIIFAQVSKSKSHESQIRRFYARIIKRQKGCPMFLKLHAELHGTTCGGVLETLRRYIWNRHFKDWSRFCSNLRSKLGLHFDDCSDVSIIQTLLLRRIKVW